MINSVWVHWTVNVCYFIQYEKESESLEFLDKQQLILLLLLRCIKSWKRKLFLSRVLRSLRSNVTSFLPDWSRTSPGTKQRASPPNRSTSLIICLYMNSQSMNKLHLNFPQFFNLLKQIKTSFTYIMCLVQTNLIVLRFIFSYKPF